MSVRKDARSQYYTYEFQIHGRRFYGSTKRTAKREALAVEQDEREKARQKIRLEAKLLSGPLLLRVACGRYWKEVGQFHSGADTTWTNLQRLIEYFGPDTKLADITDEKVAGLIAWRRGQFVTTRRKRPGGAEPKLVSNATVNRSTLEPLKKLFNRAQHVWGYEFKSAEGKSTVPNWSAYTLSEPEERVRELKADEVERHLADLRDDYAPFFAFVREVAPRLRECLIRWSDVNFETGLIETTGKGKRAIRIVITKSILAILRAQQGHHPEWVFTYVARKTIRRPGMTVIAGTRYPITYSGVQSYWRRHRNRAGLGDFRFHDFRHDLGTKLLRKTGNLKMVQKALNHRNIKTTTRYAHVMDDDLRDGLESVSESRISPRSLEAKKTTA